MPCVGLIPFLRYPLETLCLYGFPDPFLQVIHRIFWKLVFFGLFLGFSFLCPSISINISWLHYTRSYKIDNIWFLFWQKIPIFLRCCVSFPIFITGNFFAQHLSIKILQFNHPFYFLPVPSSNKKSHLNFHIVCITVIKNIRQFLLIFS